MANDDRRKCVVLWYNKAGRDMMAYPPYAVDEFEALRKAGGVFTFLLDRDVHADVMSTGEVHWEGSTEHRRFLRDALHFRDMYKQKRDKARLTRGKRRVEKINTTPPPPIQSPTTRKSKISPDHPQLPLEY